MPSDNRDIKITAVTLILLIIWNIKAEPESKVSSWFIIIPGLLILGVFIHDIYYLVCNKKDLSEDEQETDEKKK